MSFRQVHLLLGVALAVAVVAAASIGAFTFTPSAMVHFLAQAMHIVPSTLNDALDRNVFLQLRLPRVVLCGVTGAVLGVSGTLMQGMFRNPIVEPGLAGTSAGAAFGAALVFVLGGRTTLAFAARPRGPLKYSWIHGWSLSSSSGIDPTAITLPSAITATRSQMA